MREPTGDQRWDGRTVPPPLREALVGGEGLSLTPYDDNGGLPGGTWTIGYGATRDLAGQPVTERTAPITVDEAERLLERDVADAMRSVRGAIFRGLTHHQAAALILLAYNLGGLRTAAPTLVRLVNDRPDALPGVPARLRRRGAQEDRRLHPAAAPQPEDRLAVLADVFAELPSRRAVFAGVDWPPLPGAPGQQAGPAVSADTSADELNARELVRVREPLAAAARGERPDG